MYVDEALKVTCKDELANCDTTEERWSIRNVLYTNRSVLLPLYNEKNKNVKKHIINDTSKK